MGTTKREWFELFSSVTSNHPNLTGGYLLEYPKGVSQAALDNAEQKLGFEIPIELQSLLIEFNGVEEFMENDQERLQVGSIIWSLSSIVEWHKTWTIPNNRKLFCFGSSVLGNCFGYILVNGKPKGKEIWQSDHETQYPEEIITRLASSLKEFITSSLVETRWQ